MLTILGLGSWRKLMDKEFNLKTNCKKDALILYLASEHNLGGKNIGNIGMQKSFHGLNILKRIIKSLETSCLH